MKPITRLLIWLFFFLEGGVSFALSVDCPDFPEKVQQAQMIFDGTVSQVAVRQAYLPNGCGMRAGNPHTFYTFAINRIFKGRVAGDGDTVTLRFEGGDIRDAKGVAIVGESIPGVPTFKTGDRAILFVKNNGDAMSPLVCWGTHYKIWRPDDLPRDSQEAWITQDKKVIFKPSEERLQYLVKKLMRYIDEDKKMIDEFNREKHPLPPHKYTPFKMHLRDLMEGPDAEYLTPAGLWMPPSDAKPYDPNVYADILAQRIEKELEKQALTGKAAEPPPVESQDINKPFYVNSDGRTLDSRGKLLHSQHQ